MIPSPTLAKGMSFHADQGDRHPRTLSVMHNLASARMALGRSDDAISLMDECVQLRSSVLGPNHKGTRMSEEKLHE